MPKEDKREAKFSSKSPCRKHASLMHDLGLAIVDGLYKPGETMLGELEYSSRFGISRGVYREAIRSLAAKGLLESRPRTGTRVSARANWNILDHDVLSWTFEGTPDADFIRELFELRLIVEPGAAEIAARRRTGTDLARMGHALEEMAIHGITTRPGQEADLAFHHSLLLATHNETLIALGNSINAIVDWTTLFKQRNHKLVRDPVPEHRALFDAIVDANALQAKEAMINLIHLALADVDLEGFPVQATVGSLAR